MASGARASLVGPLSILIASGYGDLLTVVATTVMVVAVVEPSGSGSGAKSMLVVEAILARLPPGFHQPLSTWAAKYAGPQLSGPVGVRSLPSTLYKVCKSKLKMDGGSPI